MFRLKTTELPRVFDALAAQYAPVFAHDFPNGPKEAFFPQAETLFCAKAKNNKIEILPAPAPDTKPLAIFGLRACDHQGIHVLDAVFAEDAPYQARRAGAVLITQACNNPAATCFCKPFGVDAALENPGGDILTWATSAGRPVREANDEATPAGEWLYWEAATPKGHALTEAVRHLLEETDGTPVAQIKKDIAQKIDALPNNQLSLENLDMALFDVPAWDALFPICLGCSACTFLCPTCQCYDIADVSQNDLEGGVCRCRTWDSCMNKDFTQMAHGNPRPTGKERFRQRYMHKLVYHPARHNGQWGCTGCGRCAAKCPVGMNMIKAVKALTQKGDF